MTVWDYLDSQMWQTVFAWHGTGNEKKKFVHWILSLHATKFYEAKVSSFCMGKLFIK